VTACPSCRGSLQKTNCLPLQQLIRCLKVKCPNHDDEEEEDDDKKDTKKSAATQPATKKRRKSAVAAARGKRCSWIGKLEDLPKHQQTTCKFEMVQCDHDACSQKLHRKNLKKHKYSCIHRPTKCNKCKQMIAHQYLQNHNCPKEMTTCAYCDARLLRQELLGIGSPTNYMNNTSANTTTARNEDGDDSSSGGDGVRGDRIMHRGENGVMRVVLSPTGRLGVRSVEDSAGSSARASSTGRASPRMTRGSLASIINNNNGSDDDDEDDTAEPVTGRELYKDIMSEQIQYILTDAECQGHYKVCPNVPLRCEFHKQGCTSAKLTRKDLAKHHVDYAQYHASLIAKAFDDVPNQVRESLAREHVTLYFAASRNSINYQGGWNLYSDSGSIAGYSNFSLKLYQHRDEDEAIHVGIRCSNSRHAIPLRDVHIRILDDVAKIGSDKEDNDFEFKCAGPQIMDEMSYNSVEFKTVLFRKITPHRRSAPHRRVMTGSDVKKIVQSDSNSSLYIVASFSLNRHKTIMLGSSANRSSPSPSPSREYADY